MSNPKMQTIDVVEEWKDLMSATALQTIDTESMMDESLATPMYVVWRQPVDTVPIQPPVSVASMLNAVFADPITWEDAEWQ
jgi:hypothetical protein